MTHLKLADKCYGPVLPLMADGVHKIVVHNDWIIMFWGFAHRRFVRKYRENRFVHASMLACIQINKHTNTFTQTFILRQTFVPVMLTLTPAESSEVVVATKKVG